MAKLRIAKNLLTFLKVPKRFFHFDINLLQGEAYVNPRKFYTRNQPKAGVAVLLILINIIIMLNNRVVAIFAHNEEDRILDCLNSVKSAIRQGDICYVLNNGSTDNTEIIVSEFSIKNTFCRLVSLSVGDKANAWNYFCHKINVSANFYIFLDGDCYVFPDSIDNLEKCAINNTTANAIAGFPYEQSSIEFRKKLIEEGGIAGNFYGVSDIFMERIKKHKIKLPIGLIGDDSLISSLACWDLNPKGIWDKKKIITCHDAIFAYKKLSYFSIKDYVLYIKRKIRYSTRYYQMQLLNTSMKEKGISGIPDNVKKLYLNNYDDIKIRWRGTDTIFDLIALIKIKNNIDQDFS